MSLSGKIRMSITALNTLAGYDLATPQENVNQSLEKTVSAGVMYHARITIADGGTSSIDVSDASLSDVFGNTIDMITVSALYISASTDNTTDVTIVTGTTPIVEDLPPLSAGEGVSFLSDIDVTTNSKLHFSNGSGATADIDVIITGVES